MAGAFTALPCQDVNLPPRKTNDTIAKVLGKAVLYGNAPYKLIVLHGQHSIMPIASSRPDHDHWIRLSMDSYVKSL